MPASPENSSVDSDAPAAKSQGNAVPNNTPAATSSSSVTTPARVLFSELSQYHRTTVERLMETFGKLRNMTEKSTKALFPNGKDTQLKPVHWQMVVEDVLEARSCSGTLRAHRAELTTMLPPLETTKLQTTQEQEAKLKPPQEAELQAYHQTLALTVLLIEMAEFCRLMGGSDQSKKNLFMLDMVLLNTFRKDEDRVVMLHSVLNHVFRTGLSDRTSKELQPTLRAFHGEARKLITDPATQATLAQWQQEMLPSLENMLDARAEGLMNVAISEYNHQLSQHGRYEDRIRPVHRKYLLVLGEATNKTGYHVLTQAEQVAEQVAASRAKAQAATTLAGEALNDDDEQTMDVKEQPQAEAPISATQHIGHIVVRRFNAYWQTIMANDSQKLEALFDKDPALETTHRYSKVKQETLRKLTF